MKSRLPSPLRWAWLVLPWWAGCARSEPVGAEPEPGVVATAPAVAPAPPSEVYGAGFDEGVPYVELAQVIGEPTAWLGRPLRTAGQVERVCQKRGCWLELGAEGLEPLRVPMAGHAFSVPQALVGRRAEVQGTLTALALPEAHRAHVAAEGATALGPLALTASAVRPLP